MGKVYIVGTCDTKDAELPRQADTFPRGVVSVRNGRSLCKNVGLKRRYRNLFAEGRFDGCSRCRMHDAERSVGVPNASRRRSDDRSGIVFSAVLAGPSFHTGSAHVSRRR
jgi:hypothetical protein